MREDWMRDISGLGGLPIYLVAALTAFAIGEKSLAYQLAAGLGFGYLATVLIRLAWFRKRPEAQKYKNWLEKIDASSFPSLHAMRSAVFWSLLALFFNQIALYLAFAVVIISIAWTRVWLKRHHPSDVAAGLAIGLALAYFVAQNAGVWMALAAMVGL
jgi:membrane-associated phospholipid phosphatase